MIRNSRQYPQPARAPLRRPGAVTSRQGHSLTDSRANARLAHYETGVKGTFDAIIPVLKQLSARQHEPNFETVAQQLVQQQLGFALPEELLAAAWVTQLDMRKLYAMATFSTYRQFADRFYSDNPLGAMSDAEFEPWLQSCGFHTLDISPCADGRLAHLIRYVLRLPHRAVRRKSYAGSLFDIEDSLQKWVEVEMLRYREGRPNLADEPTRYLKVVAYHFSSVDPEHEGCAAHGSDTEKAAKAGLERLLAFQQAIENSFCCGASIDLLLLGLDTDTDAIRIHLPDGKGELALNRYVDTLQLYQQSYSDHPQQAEQTIESAIGYASPDIDPGMARFIQAIAINNLSQIDYVKQHHGSHYHDIGHAERFIGAGVGFEEIQLRNLMYFAYLNTVEEATQDLDVGIKIFTGLNVSRSLPIPIVIRFDYHSRVPGARERAVEKCQRVAAAINSRYAELATQGLLHTLQVIRDCNTHDAPLETLHCSVKASLKVGAH
ncbi:carboxysome shell carbonic anhydrase [Ectothiorhodospiraceae bacterium BW-2]|nr:carboxysome shell carbonic anhydrase [Ectothiorhodospiraceae bacterium BW-2]